MSKDSLPLDEDEFEALSEEGVVWRLIPGFTRYEASSLGAIMSWRVPEGRLLAAARGKTTLVDDEGQAAYKSVGAFVALAFMTPRQPGTRLRYLDGDHLNSAVANMQWETDSESGYRKLTPYNRAPRVYKPRPLKTHCFRGHLLTEDNIRADSKYGRACVICNIAASKAARIRKQQRKRGEPDTMTTEDVLLERGQIEFDVLLTLW